MKRFNLRALIFMALCCDLGLISKKLIGPAANIITEFLHIPGGIATSFSLMFLIIAAWIIPLPGCACIMGAVQSLLALCFGTTGSMGILAPIGYILPGAAIDIILLIWRKTHPAPSLGIMLSSIAASVTACLVANFIVFRLPGLVLLLYICVAATSGAICSVLANVLIERLSPIIKLDAPPPLQDADTTIKLTGEGK